jgi:hypothetical protein
VYNGERIFMRGARMNRQGDISMYDPTQKIRDLAFDTSPDRTLIVHSAAGLNNRIRVLISGIALAEAAGRKFAMLWPDTPACGVKFDVLFQNKWPVIHLSVLPAEPVSFYFSKWSNKRLKLLLEYPHQHITLRYHSWFIRPEGKTAYASIQRRCLQLLNELQPIESILTRIESFRAVHFSPTMIGVHLRRGDFNRCRPHFCQNTSMAFRIVDRFLEYDPLAGILLCTDDGAVDPKTGKPTTAEGVHARFVERYGKRVVWSSPRSLDRTPEAVQDALVDLWLLRSTNYFVGTYGSSLSDMAVVGRSIPHILCVNETAMDVQLEKVLNKIGLGTIVRFVSHLYFDGNLPFPLAWRWFVRLPLVLLRFMLRTLGIHRFNRP